jgi:ADP-ribosylglycohydrolase
VEGGVFMGGGAGNPGWKNVYLWFKEAGAWPIDGYTPGYSPAAERLGIDLNPWCQLSERENIRFMQSDDDIRYTVLGLILLEEKGLDFDTWDVGMLWHNRLAYHQVFTAEDRTYANLVQATAGVRGSRPGDWKERLEWARMHRNPYREWIGAQIRADGWAYAAAGNPELAAELAWRDASLSHVKNGIYGEMFAAAMIAAAFVEPSVDKIIAIGLSEIPRSSRLAEAVLKAAEIAHTSTSQLELVERVWNAFCDYHPVHTINNAALVAAALVWAQDDYEKAITTAVLGGWDTDCNGATVGSIMGAKLGASALPSKWIAPLNDTLYADLYGFHPIAISECAKRSYEVYRKNMK